jgi:hypothetical protein
LKTLIEIKDTLGMGNSLIQFKSAGLLHQSAKVEIQPSVIGTPELPFIIDVGVVSNSDDQCGQRNCG